MTPDRRELSESYRRRYWLPRGGADELTMTVEQQLRVCTATTKPALGDFERTLFRKFSFAKNRAGGASVKRPPFSRAPSRRASCPVQPVHNSERERAPDRGDGQPEHDV